MDTSEDPPSSEKPLKGPVDVEDSGPTLPKSEGWRVDFTTILKYFMDLHYPGITPIRVRQAIRAVLQWLEERREYWQLVREHDPIAFMNYLAQVVQEQTGLRLPALKWYTKWIKASSWRSSLVSPSVRGACIHPPVVNVEGYNLRASRWGSLKPHGLHPPPQLH